MPTAAQVAHQNELITYRLPNIFGQFFKCSRRTAAHLDYTIAELKKVNPQAVFHIIQGCYNTTVSASAGTHDYDAVLDVAIAGMDWNVAQLFLRRHGWAAWWRKPPTFTNHIHMVSLGYTSRVGVFVPGQVSDYYANRSGLVGHAMDPTPHPDPQWVFDFYEYLGENREDQMQKEDWERMESMLDRHDQVTRRQIAAFRTSLRKRDALMISLLRNIEQDVDQIEAGSKDDATKRQVAGLRKKINDSTAELEAAIVAEHDDPLEEPAETPAAHK